MVLQAATQEVPSLLSYWRELLVIIAGNSVITGVVLRAVGEDWFVKTLDRCKDRVMFRIDEWYKDRRARIDEAIDLAKAHEDSMNAFEEALKAQGVALNRTLDEHSQNHTQALKAITATLVDIQKEARATAESVARIDERTKRQPWDGVERRAHDRRGGPNS